MPVPVTVTIAAFPTFTLPVYAAVKSLPATSFLPPSVTVYAGFTALPVYTTFSGLTTASEISTPVITNVTLTLPVNPLPFLAVMTAFAVPTFSLSLYAISNASNDVTVSDFPCRSTVIMLRSGFTAEPVYS